MNIGEHFGSYELLEQIGQGGMGIVFKVLDRRNDSILALKLLTKEQGSDDVALKRFIQEARTTAQLSHPNIVKIFEVGSTPQHYIAMEYIEGNTLKSFIRQRRISPIKTAIYLEKVARALEYSHSQGVIHRDVKSSNIMIDYDQQVKVMDFGLAKVMDVSNSLTKTGETVGTPVYMAPEQIESNSGDERSDVYSMGATLYEALLGEPPFQGDTYFSVVQKVLNEDVPKLRKISADIPPDLETICLRCLEKRPEDRYQNMHELADDLRRFIEYKPIVVKAASPLDYLKKQLRRRLLFVITAAVVIILTSLVFLGIDFAKAMEKQVAEEQLLLEAEKKLENLHGESSIVDYIEAFQKFDEILAVNSENQQARRGKFEALLRATRYAMENKDYTLAKMMCSLALEMHIDDLQVEGLLEEVESLEEKSERVLSKKLQEALDKLRH